MRLPIQFALTYPERLDTGLKSLDFAQLKCLNFATPDFDKFPSLELAFYVARRGGTLPCVLNAADEEAVEAFLEGRIKFTKIYSIVEKVVLSHKTKSNPDLETILGVDAWARQEARKHL
jgi:1-deoxy-D-xylulose-5-phosphate reductoisomerase